MPIRHVEDRSRGEQVEAERRRVEADAQIDRHDDAEVDGIDTGGFDDGQQQRRQDQNRGRWLEKTSRHQQPGIDEQQRFPGWQIERADLGYEMLRNAARGHEPRIDPGAGHDDQDLRDQEDRAHDDLPEIDQVDFTINEHRDENRIDHRDAGGLGGSEHAAVDAAENHHDGADRPARFLGRGPDVFPARGR